MSKSTARLRHCCPGLADFPVSSSPRDRCQTLPGLPVSKVISTPTDSVGERWGDTFPRLCKGPSVCSVLFSEIPSWDIPGKRGAGLVWVCKPRGEQEDFGGQSRRGKGMTGPPSWWCFLSVVLTVFFCLLFETGSYYIIHAGIEHTVLPRLTSDPPASAAQMLGF